MQYLLYTLKASLFQSPDSGNRSVLQYVRRSTELPGESPCLPYQAQQDRASDLQN